MWQKELISEIMGILNQNKEEADADWRGKDAISVNTSVVISQIVARNICIALNLT